jgi:hypothetical protein
VDHRLAGRPRPVQRRGIGRFLEMPPRIEFGRHIRDVLRPDKPEAALLTGQVADDSAQAFHRQEPLRRVLVRDAFQATKELAAGESQLID